MLDPDVAAPGAAAPASPTPAIDGPIVDWDATDEDLEQPEGTPPAQPPAAPAPAVPAAPGAPASAQPPTPPAAQPPTPAATPAGAGAEPAPAGTAPTPPTSAAAAPSVWEFQADGQTVVVEGSVRHPDGSVTIPASMVPHLETLGAEGAAHRGSWRREQEGYQDRIATLEREVANKVNDPELLRARAYNKQLLDLLEKGPDAVAAWLDNYQQNFPVFQAKAEEAILRAQLAERDAWLNAAEEERLSDEIAPKISQTIEGAVTRLAAQHPGVNAAQLHQRILARHLDQVAYEVPAAERPRGLAEGEVLLGRGPKGELYIVNEGLIADEFAYQASLLKGSAAAAQAAVAHNAAISAPPPVVAPPVPVTGPAPGAGEAKMPEFPNTPEGKQQMQDWIDSGDWRKTVFPSTR